MITVGGTEGALDGFTLGLNVGDEVIGFTVGGTEGALDGFTLGLNVGDEVIGFFVGGTEGDAVIVGLPVGEAESQGVP